MRCGALLLLLAVAHGDDDEKKCWKNVHKAANRGDSKKMAQLLAKDRFQADSEDKCESGVRPLMLAAHGGHTDIVRQLILAGASVDVAHTGNGITPLMAAAAHGDVEMLELILSRPLSINRAESRNWTALSFASQYGHAPCVAALLDRGADPGWRTGAGLTPWALAKDADQQAVLAVLEARGAPTQSASAIWLVGTLPTEALSKRGVVDVDAFSSKLLGAYSFARVMPGMDAEQLAIYSKLQQMSSGGGADDGAIEASSSDVGGGPMPSYLKATAASEAASASEAAGEEVAPKEEVVMIAFDPKPGAQIWQVAGMQAAEGQTAKGVVYLRGTPARADAEGAISNVLDAANVPLWEVRVRAPPPPPTPTPTPTPRPAPHGPRLLQLSLGGTLLRASTPSSDVRSCPVAHTRSTHTSRSPFDSALRPRAQVAVGVVQKAGGRETAWVAAPGLKAVAGEDGARLWAEQVAASQQEGFQKEEL